MSMIRSVKRFFVYSDSSFYIDKWDEVNMVWWLLHHSMKHEWCLNQINWVIFPLKLIVEIKQLDPIKRENEI